MSYWKTLITYNNPAEAETDQAYLESEGFEVYLLNANTSRNELGAPFYVQLQVPADRHAEAAARLRKVNPSRFGDPDVADAIERQILRSLLGVLAIALPFGLAAYSVLPIAGGERLVLAILTGLAAALLIRRIIRPKSPAGNKPEAVSEKPRQEIVTLSVTIAASLDLVWMAWTTPDHITRWNSASDDWHCPSATNDFRTGGRFSYRMAPRDGGEGFDFEGTYVEIIPHQLIRFTIEDGREVQVGFAPLGETTVLTETFATETMHSVDAQRAGWTAILHRFKTHVETL